VRNSLAGRLAALAIPDIVPNFVYIDKPMRRLYGRCHRNERNRPNTAIKRIVRDETRNGPLRRKVEDAVTAAMKHCFFEERSRPSDFGAGLENVPRDLVLLHELSQAGLVSHCFAYG